MHRSRKLCSKASVISSISKYASLTVQYITCSKKLTLAFANCKTTLQQSSIETCTCCSCISIGTSDNLAACIMPLPFSLTSIFVQAAYFEQKFYATFFLAPEAAAPPKADSSQIQRRSERTQSADSRSPRLSPRDRPASNQVVCLAQEHPAAGVKEPTNAQQDKLAAERHGQPSHEPASVGGRQPAQGRSRSSTPDLSPRGDPEADDPPTPRMYKSIVPTAALNQAAQHHSDHSHCQKLHQNFKAGNSQVILHQGHYDHGKRDISPPRQSHAHEGASQQAIEDLQHTIRQSFLALYVCVHLSVYACVSLLQMQNGRRQTI